MSLPTPIGRQRDVLYLPAKGHFVGLGTAGSGKTTLAILRSAFLGNPNTGNSGRTLLVTFNRALVTYLKHFQDPSFKNVTVENYHLFARGYLHSRGRMGYNTICQPPLRAKLIDAAVSNATASSGHHAIFARGNEFFSGEIQWIEQHGITSLPQYLQAERVGRDGVPLDRKSRQVAFGVLQDYLARRKAAHKDFDWDDMATAVCAEMDADSSSRLYKHIVIDEGQDFSPQMIRSLAKGIPQDGSLTFFGDMAQQIYGRRMSWKSAGLNVSKVWEFKENYRNTKQVAAAPACGLELARSSTASPKKTLPLMAASAVRKTTSGELASSPAGSSSRRAITASPSPAVFSDKNAKNCSVTGLHRRKRKRRWSRWSRGGRAFGIGLVTGGLIFV